MIQIALVVSMLVLEGSIIAATRCAPDVQSARLYQRVFGRPLHLPCPLYQCRGGQVLEQYNMTTRKYDIIDDGHHHLIGYNDGGSLRCSQRCNSTFRQYCYFKVQVIPEIAEVKMDFPVAVLNKSYIATCDTAGDPRPIVNATLTTVTNCPHEIFTFNITTYTAQAVLRIPSVTAECSGAIFLCTVCQLGTCQEVTKTINIVEGTRQNTSSDHSLTTTDDMNNEVVDMTSRADSHQGHVMLYFIVTLTVIGWCVL